MYSFEYLAVLHTQLKAKVGTWHLVFFLYATNAKRARNILMLFGLYLCPPMTIYIIYVWICLYSSLETNGWRDLKRSNTNSNICTETKARRRNSPSSVVNYCTFENCKHKLCRVYVCMRICSMYIHNSFLHGCECWQRCRLRENIQKSPPNNPHSAPK